MNKIKIAVLISGRGSHLQNLIEACRKPYYPAEIALVMSDRADAPGLQYARDAGIPIITVSPYPGRAAFGAILHTTICEKNIDLVVLAGFMRILDADFVDLWDRRILNIHPSLLPAYPGLHPQQRALDAYETVSGCTVHWVVPEVDAGPILAQADVPIYPLDTENTLSDRILKVEHQLYPTVIMTVANEILHGNL